MRKIVAGLFMSLDGVVDGAEGWQYPYLDEELGAAMEAGARRAAALLLGRRSYEGYEALRIENPDSPVLALIDRTRTYVVSSTLARSPQGVSIIDRDLIEQIAALRDENDGDVLVLGSPTLVRWLLAHDLLNELHLFMLPIVVGSGLRLFDDTAPRRYPLELVHSRAMGNGALDVHYTPKAPWRRAAGRRCGARARVRHQVARGPVPRLDRTRLVDDRSPTQHGDGIMPTWTRLIRAEMRKLTRTRIRFCGRSCSSWSPSPR
ncbi:MAG TPA: dihydrofolate reductase family protein [Jiangellaceae bacterium]|nr:dihydrofolate reductase family protein [Jiangellaceae bacterium]